MASEKRPSPVLVQEYIAAGDDRFLEELARFNSPRPLASLAAKWKIDPQP